MTYGYVTTFTRTKLGYDVLVSGLAPVRDDPMPGGGQPHWSPLSHTLMLGDLIGRAGRLGVSTPLLTASTLALRVRNARLKS